MTKLDKSIPMVADTMDVYVAYTNTDLTEGRGEEIPMAVCMSRSTAARLGKRQGVMGTNCSVHKQLAVRLAHSSTWLVPWVIHKPNPDDIAQDQKFIKLEAVIEKAKAAGLTEEEIKLLVSAK